MKVEPRSADRLLIHADPQPFLLQSGLTLRLQVTAWTNGGQIRDVDVALLCKPNTSYAAMMAKNPFAKDTVLYSALSRPEVAKAGRTNKLLTEINLSYHQFGTFTSYPPIEYTSSGFWVHVSFVRYTSKPELGTILNYQCVSGLDPAMSLDGKRPAPGKHISEDTIGPLGETGGAMGWTSPRSKRG